MVEWRASHDCWTRYLVTSTPQAAVGASTVWLGVQGVTYAFTGCSGAIPSNTAATVDWGELADLGGSSLTSPIRHGVFQVVPEDWSGAIHPGETHELPEGAPPYPPYAETRDVSVARGFPYWRDPELPLGWTFIAAFTGGIEFSYGYCASYKDADGYAAVEICGQALLGPGTWGLDAAGRNTPGTIEYVSEARWISGRPAAVRYSLEGPLAARSLRVLVMVHDMTTQSIYTVMGLHRTLRGSNVDAGIAIARSLFEPPNPP